MKILNIEYLILMFNINPYIPFIIIRYLIGYLLFVYIYTVYLHLIMVLISSLSIKNYFSILMHFEMSFVLVMTKPSLFQSSVIQ